MSSPIYIYIAGDKNRNLKAHQTLAYRGGTDPTSPSLFFTLTMYKKTTTKTF